MDQKSRLKDEGYFGKIQHDNTRANEPTNTSLQELPTSFCMQNPMREQDEKNSTKLISQESE